MRICFFTGTRAEYGLLKPLIMAVRDADSFEFSLLASGAHLSTEFGMTVREIENDGIEISERVEMLVSSDTDTAICKSMGLGLIGFGDALSRLRPDLFVVLGDRYEVLAAASAAMICRIPILHIHGGESSEGLIDEQIRHAVTKISHLHFTSTEFYRQRVINMGEAPSRVVNTGAIGLSDIRTIELINKKEVFDFFRLDPNKDLALVTFHPVTLEPHMAESHFKAMRDALFSKDNLQIVFTKANADSEGRIINELIDESVSLFPERSRSYFSLGRHRYLSAMKASTFVAGNSSSGIIEAPSLGVPSINIGDRQKGRVKAESVIDCEVSLESIKSSIELAMSSEFRNLAAKIKNPYEKTDTIAMMLEAIKESVGQGLLHKAFCDIGEVNSI